MKVLCYIGMGLALAVAGTSAFAFQEQGAAAPVAPPSSAEAKPVAPAEQGLDLSTPGVAGAKEESGTEVRIPGLGKLGVLPKMDFGLELLYGANESRQPDAVDPQMPEDLTVRGTLKHNF